MARRPNRDGLGGPHNRKPSHGRDMGDLRQRAAGTPARGRRRILHQIHRRWVDEMNDALDRRCTGDNPDPNAPRRTRPPASLADALAREQDRTGAAPPRLTRIALRDRTNSRGQLRRVRLVLNADELDAMITTALNHSSGAAQRGPIRVETYPAPPERRP